MSSLTESTARTVQELNALSRDQLLELFSHLESPELSEFSGEFVGYGAPYLPDLEGHYLHAGLGRWLGKGYLAEPYGDWAGHGYNLWQPGDGVTRRARFGWRLDTSMMDVRPCLLMHYAAFSNIYADLDLIDEIRKVENDVFLGLATTREPSPLAPDPGGPQGRSLPSTFLLVGPPRPWAGPDDSTGETHDNSENG